MLPAPQMTDGLTYFALLPTLSTLYGYEGVTRYIRVVDDNVSPTVTNRTREGILVEQIDTITVTDFLLRCSYGDTTMIESVYSGIQSGIDLSAFKSKIINQACLRNYEQRATTLLKLCRTKRASFVSASMHGEKVRELVAEMEGVLTCWKHLMDTGEIRAYECVRLGENKRNLKRSSVPLADFEERTDILKRRLLNENFYTLPYKMSAEERVNMLRTYGRM